MTHGHTNTSAGETNDQILKVLCNASKLEYLAFLNGKPFRRAQCA